MATEYEFALESVLRVNRVEKDQRVADLMEAEMERDRLAKRLEECRGRITGIEEEMNEEIGVRALDVAALIIKKSFIRCLRNEEERLLKAVFEQDEMVERRRNAVMEKSREQKVIEKLKEKDYQRFLQKQQKQNQIAVDEVVVLRHGHSLVH